MFAIMLLAALWFKGTTHVHTLESDGDAPPAQVAQWYRERGYHFIAITDHDKITELPSDEKFVVIRAEEVTDRLPKKPLHVNALGLREAVKPQGGATPVDVMQHNVDAIHAAGGLALLNHPNFGWALTLEDLLRIERFDFLEIASGHPLVNVQGPPSVESMWDALLTSGRRVWGVAVDDSHHFVCPPPVSAALPGQAWIVVRAEKLTSDALLGAMKRGDFYASTGVELEDVAPGAIAIKAKSGAKYRTTFIGRGGRVLLETQELNARYTIRGDEGYVRA
ncbi:MAG TPA: CehA/McbA family metallohydrolase, partial [Thermoanaerobaculia bacterium]